MFLLFINLVSPAVLPGEGAGGDQRLPHRDGPSYELGYPTNNDIYLITTLKDVFKRYFFSYCKNFRKGCLILNLISIRRPSNLASGKKQLEG